MAAFAYYGGVQPSEYRALPRSHAPELLRRIKDLHAEDAKADVEFQAELVTIVVKAIGTVAKIIGRRPTL